MVKFKYLASELGVWYDVLPQPRIKRDAEVLEYTKSHRPIVETGWKRHVNCSWWDMRRGACCADARAVGQCSGPIKGGGRGRIIGYTWRS